MAEPPPSPDDSLIGRTVAGRYRVISKLGEGGMGVTYRAWDEREGRPVVLKMPRRNLIENAAFLERFNREVRMMAALSHPSIVPILDVGEDEGLPILVMRFLPGGSLSNRRLRDTEGKVQPMQPSTLQLWLPAVASALDFVHANGIVHRDVKPANIFFDAFWGAHLGDFGIAKIVEDTTVLEKEHTLTATSMAIGTQEYMAPEQFTPKAVVDGRVDQYALAVMVYEILIGQRPFRGETAHLVVEVTTQPVPRVTQFRRDLPDSVCQAVYRGLSKKPGERFASCAEFAQAVLRDVRPMADEEGVARLLCPQCGNMLKMPTSAAGRQGKCTRCKTEMVVAEDLGALWLAHEEHDGEEQAAGGVGEQESEVDSVDVFPSIPNTTPVPKAGVRGIWSQLDPTVRWAGIGAAILASLVATALLAGDYAAGAARKQLDAATATQKKLVVENERLEKKVAELNDANVTLKQAVENLAAEKKQLSEKLAAGSNVSDGTKEAATVPAESSPQSAPAQLKAVTNSIGIEFVDIPAGKFQMGEGPSAVAVTLTRPFYMGVHEVTNAQWNRVMGSVPSGWKEDARPVGQVSWEDAVEFCRKLSALPEERKAGRMYRLPTEAEWEYACRAGTTTQYSFGADGQILDDYGWFDGNSGNETHLVGQKKPNAWGLYDMHGNVWEWCGDWHGDYPDGEVTDPQGPSSGSLRVNRGGSWYATAGGCRSAERSWSRPSRRDDDLGFRLALSPSGAESQEAGTDQGTKIIAPPEGSTPAAGDASVNTPASAAAALNLPKRIGGTFGINMTLIPAGTFTMGEATGESNEKPHRVTLTKPFYMGVHEVTNAQWKQVMGSVPSDWKEDAHPVQHVSLDDAVEFCRKLSALPKERKAGRVYRLPTEAEWEYTCRAGTTTQYSFGDDESLLGDYGWFDGNSNKQTHPVGQRKPNAWGLYDMHGNVWEWCSDWYANYPDGEVTNPQGPSSGSIRAIRGGSWYRAAKDCRSAYRARGEPSRRRNNMGFRLALSTSISQAELNVESEIDSDPSEKALSLDTENNSIGMTLLEIPPGKFRMGEGPSAVAVTLTRPFLLGKTEVTRGQWQQVMGTTPWAGGTGASDAELPAVNVSWENAREFCEKLTARERSNGTLTASEAYRLPTEAEWEYVCRAGTTTAFSFGDDDSLLGDFGWFNANSGGNAHPVGAKKPNAWGLHDMHGNVWEWCSDWNDGKLAGGVDPEGPTTGLNRMHRGGSWLLTPVHSRSAFRSDVAPSFGHVGLGFRVARSQSRDSDVKTSVTSGSGLRRKWVQDDGARFFQREADSPVWREHGRDGKAGNVFNHLSETADYVEIVDGGRKMVIRLWSDRWEWTTGATTGPWNAAQKGRWEK
jgi:formylglycine-generating enzyme required for sulfatase activity/tRNA A-37 threonylcarbamoyl transferase component Bud32